MFDFVFAGVSDLVLKSLKRDSASIDNTVFKLHYRGTVIILLGSFGLVTSGQFFGNPINCMTDSMSGGVMDSYCWIHSTFTVQKNFAGTLGVHHSQPGVGPVQSEDRVHHHKFYQWVVFVITLQAAMFYLPRFIWKSYEGGVMKLLTNGLMDITCFMDGDAKSDGLSRIEKFYKMSGNGRGKFFLMFLFCEILNLTNVVGQIFFMDRFLGYQFSSFGTDVIGQTEGNFTERTDALNMVFPKVAKCKFNKFGVSGSVQSHDALCVLSLNIINEKIYVAMWFWFVFLAAVSAVFMLYRLALIFSSNLRVYVLHQKCEGLVRKEKVRAALENPDHNLGQRLGDYWMLYLLTKNLNPLVAKDMYAVLTPDRYMRGKEEELEALKKNNHM